jgi:hypothetical protein
MDTRGNSYINAVDHGVLTFIRSRLISWKPSRRFEYAMEKSVLILSDLDLVTGLGILLASYSQLDCGISAYHWQIMVFVAWFASFSFVSAMTFLEGYFQTNNSMRIIRVFFMIVLASLLIAALLPTGSSMWLNQYPDDDQGFYPSLSTACFYKELSMKSFLRRGPKVWSMIFSVIIIAFSYIHCGVRLFDPTASTSRKYLRTLPGSYGKQLLHTIELRARSHVVMAHVWHFFYLMLYAGFISNRAFYDISESMLLEIIWLTFAMAWGTIKVWETRAAATYNFNGETFTLNMDVLVENSWSFGQILPLILLLLPLLSMAQAYLDNDAKAQEAMQKVNGREDAPEEGIQSTIGTSYTDAKEGASTRANNLTPTPRSTSYNDIPPTRTPFVHLPPYPYPIFTAHSWYTDHILLLLCQIIMVTTMALYVLTKMADIFGISSILRSRLFLIWGLAMIPLGSFIHLAVWYVAACIVQGWPSAERWLMETGNMVGKVVYWTLRLGLVAGCLMFTFFVSLELAGPKSLWDSLT